MKQGNKPTSIFVVLGDGNMIEVSCRERAYHSMNAGDIEHRRVFIQGVLNGKGSSFIPNGGQHPSIRIGDRTYPVGKGLDLNYTVSICEAQSGIHLANSPYTAEIVDAQAKKNLPLVQSYSWQDFASTLNPSRWQQRVRESCPRCVML